MGKVGLNIPGLDFDPALFLVFIVLPIAAALLCLYNAFRFLKRARVLEDTPFSKIRSAAQGYIEIEGIASPLNSQLLLGELSKKPCVWYRYKIEELRTYYNQNETFSRWELVQQGASSSCFLLTDGTGECIVIPAGADIITTSTLRWYGNSFPPTGLPEPSLWTFLFGTGGRFCFIEQRIELNTKVYATGMFYSLATHSDFLQSHPEIQTHIARTGTSTVNILNNEGLGQKQSLLISAHTERSVAREYRFKAFVFFLSFLFFAFLLVTSSYPTVLKSIHAWQHNP